jgi:hypothetical protein
MPKCKACGASIQFYKTPDGKRMPVDTAPNPDGNLVLDGQDDDGNRMVRMVDLFTPSGAVLYMPHWATCTSSDEFRNGKEEDGRITDKQI